MIEGQESYDGQKSRSSRDWEQAYTAVTIDCFSITGKNAHFLVVAANTVYIYHSKCSSILNDRMKEGGMKAGYIVVYKEENASQKKADKRHQQYQG
jgi:hypothetical protein